MMTSECVRYKREPPPSNNHSMRPNRSGCPAKIGFQFSGMFFIPTSYGPYGCWSPLTWPKMAAAAAKNT